MLLERPTRRPAPRPARGVLRTADPDGVSEHRRLLPSVELRPFVAHFWWVAWDLQNPFVAETLPHPSIHAVFEMPLERGEIAGVSTERFVRVLQGRGRAFGIKFRPAGFYPFVQKSIATFSETTLP